MRLLVILLFILFHLSSSAQDEKKLSDNDSVCFKKARAMMIHIKKDGGEKQHFIDEHFFVFSFHSSDTINSGRIRILNIGNDKKFTVVIEEMKSEFSDSLSNSGIMHVTQPVELIKDVQLNRCESFSLNLGKKKDENGTLNRLIYLRLRIKHDGGVSLFSLGKTD